MIESDCNIIYWIPIFACEKWPANWGFTQNICAVIQKKTKWKWEIRKFVFMPLIKILCMPYIKLLRPELRKSRHWKHSVKSLHWLPWSMVSYDWTNLKQELVQTLWAAIYPFCLTKTSSTCDLCHISQWTFYFNRIFELWIKFKL